MLENMGYWQNGLELEKKLCCHMATLRGLGLNLVHNSEKSFDEKSFG